MKACEIDNRNSIRTAKLFGIEGEFFPKTEKNIGKKILEKMKEVIGVLGKHLRR